MDDEKGEPIKSCFYKKKLICATEVKIKTNPYTVARECSGGL